jgi:ferredoxin
MANLRDKLKYNAPGSFYCDNTCIDCDLCREKAPDFFKRNDQDGHSYVYKQPKTKEDIELCMETLEQCPVNAIGNNGGYR